MPKSSIAIVAVGLLLVATASQARAGQNLAELDSHEVNYKQQMLGTRMPKRLAPSSPSGPFASLPRRLAFAQYYSKLGMALTHTGDNPGAEQAFHSAISIFEANGPLYAGAANLVKRYLTGALLTEHKTDEADESGKSLPPPPVKVKNDVDPQLILSSKVEPHYTKSAKASKVSGSVGLALTIDETGQPKTSR